MPRVAGIQIEKDKKGRPAYVRINLKKHKEALSFLEQIGAVEESTFDKMIKAGITGDELRTRLHNKIEKWAWKPENLLLHCGKKIQNSF